MFDYFIGLLADSVPWFLGGAILEAAFEAWLPASWAIALVEFSARVRRPCHRRRRDPSRLLNDHLSRWPQRCNDVERDSEG
ncbi:MAG: hypothetical protein ACR2II_01255 [Chthoniobacterales bacterium]